MKRNREKTNSHLQSLLNSSFNRCIFIILSAVFLLGGVRAYAVNLSAVYISACMRETGVIINVDSNRIQLLTLEGSIRNISRFNIIYMATYPAGNVRIPEVSNAAETELISVKTIFQGKVEDLVKGWMIDYYEDQISFLTLSGAHTVIDTNDIWDIDILPAEGPIEFETESDGQLEFVHPYPFMHCEKEIHHRGEGDSKIHKIYPQHLLEDPLLIKRELDRLKEGFDQIRKYASSKRFYPVPQVYTNETSLGLWVNLGSRYGASKNRSSSFIPAIISKSSEGPFGFQSRFVTGSAPMFDSIHEEPQMQANYRLKASYVHFSIMVDFSRFTMGSEKYKWSTDDLAENDNRENEVFHLSGGFDYGSFAIDLSVVQDIYYSVRHGSYFHRDDMLLNRGALFYHNRFFRMELHYGFASDRKDEAIPMPDDVSPAEKAYIEAYNEELSAIPEFYADFLFYRLNLELFFLGNIHPTYSLIYRKMDFEREEDGKGLGAFRYKGISLTNSVYLNYPLADDLRLSGFLSLETMEKKYGATGLDDSSSSVYPKGGMGLALLF